jgi:hypothetical protein
LTKSGFRQSQTLQHDVVFVFVVVFFRTVRTVRRPVRPLYIVFRFDLNYGLRLSLSTRLEEIKAYKKRLGRWTREVLAVVKDILFWTVLALMDVCNTPYKHLMAFLQTSLSDDTLNARGGHLQQMACGKAEQICSEFDSAILGSDWQKLINDNPDSAYLPGLCLGTLLCHAAGFFRRIVEPTLRFTLTNNFSTCLCKLWGSARVPGQSQVEQN